MSTIAENDCAGALDGKELFTIEGSEKWRSTPDNLEEREKWPTKAENPFIAAITTTAKSRVPVSVANWNVH